MIGTKRPATWRAAAIRHIQRSVLSAPPTRLVDFGLPPDWGVTLLLKCELEHHTGSLKQRLAAALVLDGLCSGTITEGTGIVEASSGSTAISLAYYAQLIGLRMAAVMPGSTSQDKVAAIRDAGAECILVPSGVSIEDVARETADDRGWSFLDQFSNASRVLDWRVHNIASEAYGQLAALGHASPTWVVLGAGTGGTATTFGRYIRLTDQPSRICLVDPDDSVLFDAWSAEDRDVARPVASRIEGIGRPCVPGSLRLELVERMFKVPDPASVAAMQLCHDVLGLEVGPSTGTNLWAALHLAAEMRDEGAAGSILTLACDGARRYRATVLDAAWQRANGIDPARHRDELLTLLGRVAGPA